MIIGNVSNIPDISSISQFRKYTSYKKVVKQNSKTNLEKSLKKDYFIS